MLMAGPCSVENKEMLSNIAEKVKKGGAVALRGETYKPRTSPEQTSRAMQFDAKNKRDNAPLEKVTLSHFNKFVPV